MPYFNAREIAAIALFGALWGVLNAVLLPIVFRLTGLPIFCDLVGFSSLALAVWWIRKLGAASTVGIVATILNFVFRPGAVHFLGFTAASIIFDVLTRLVGYERIFSKSASTIFSITLISIFSAAVAGLIIGTFFMAAPALAQWGGVLGWAGLHAAGGFIGGLIGATLIASLKGRIDELGLKSNDSSYTRRDAGEGH